MLIAGENLEMLNLSGKSPKWTLFDSSDLTTLIPCLTGAFGLA
jgi:hypothetical protein